MKSVYAYAVFEVTPERKTLRAVFTHRQTAIVWAVARKVQSWHVESINLYTGVSDEV